MLQRVLDIKWVDPLDFFCLLYSFLQTSKGLDLRSSLMVINSEWPVGHSFALAHVFKGEECDGGETGSLDGLIQCPLGM